MTRLCFIDTETTSLRHDRRAWEIGLIVREPGRADREHRWFVALEDLELGNADLDSLKIGRFYERHPANLAGSGLLGEVAAEGYVLAQVERYTRGAHLVGAVTNFDTEVLGARMRANGICPSWHYHLICAENLAAGWLNAYAAYLDGDGTVAESAPQRAAELRRIAAPPWKSDELSAALGITVSEEARHTALGDAAWARDIYDFVMGKPS